MCYIFCVDKSVGLTIGAMVVVAAVGFFIFYGNNNGQETVVADDSLSQVSTTPGINIGETQSQDGTIPTMDTTSELKIEDVTVGTGDEAVVGKTITVNYSGTLTNGTKFDSSYDRGTPFSFTLGEGRVIEGWEKGFTGMKVGGKRKLTIPASMGYGAQAVGSIPANSTLLFEVELLKVE